ncbi:MAG: peptide-methionine (S)-S-oxide reductase MsrA [Bacteroidetes bacterium]|nr:peptide-methionine (S)-S-oxide reductase MsrA [Bacteroidota bacterium]MBT7827812.1 peptide-methionine (S)-S-oxide reductase MsrA [Bacteroidota bacterium]
MIKKISLFVLVGLMAILQACNGQQSNMEDNILTNSETEVAVFGAGCFWCVEAIYSELRGVEKVESGYSGGKTENPTYKEVCDGYTGHAEVVKITYNPKEISFELLLSVFFKTHDPTTLNRQGADFGTQYRSAIFYTTEQQKESANLIISKLNKEKAYPDAIVTKVSALENYYPAEDHHQDYYSNNPNYGYCRAVIQPKVDKFRKVFGEYTK